MKVATEELSTLGDVIKQAYEAQDNTNAFTDDEKTKLQGIQAGAEQNAVDSVNGQVGAVVLDAGDLGAASLDSPVFTGNPQVPTALENDNDLTVASTAFVQNAVKKKPESITVAASDETTALTAGNGKAKFRMPYAMTLTAVKASLNSAATGTSLLTVDVNENGNSIFGTNKLTFDASETTTVSAATPPDLNDVALAADSEISIDIDQIGNTVAGTGLKVTLIGYQT